MNIYVAGASTHVLGVLVEAGLDELLELPCVGPLQLRRTVLGDEEQHPHRVEVRVGRLALRQLYGGDAQ